MKHFLAVCVCLLLLPAFAFARINTDAAEGIKGWLSTPVNGGKVEAQGPTKPVNDEDGARSVMAASSSRTGYVVKVKSGKEASPDTLLDHACDEGGGTGCHVVRPRRKTRLGNRRGYYGSATYVAPDSP